MCHFDKYTFIKWSISRDYYLILAGVRNVRYTSKYNPIEHRLFCHVTSACKGTIFSSIDVVKSLVDRTSMSKGLKVFSTIKDKVYATARKVSETFKENMKIVFDEYLGKWNYRAIPEMKA